MAVQLRADAIRSGLIPNKQTHTDPVLRDRSLPVALMLSPRPPGPAGHVAGRRRPKSGMHVRTAQPAVRPLSAKCGRSACLAVRSVGLLGEPTCRPCSRASLSIESRRIGAGCGQSLGALDAALCIRCKSSCISAYEVRTASSELREEVRRAGMLMSTHLLQNTYLVGRD